MPKMSKLSLKSCFSVSYERNNNRRHSNGFADNSANGKTHNGVVNQPDWRYVKESQVSYKSSAPEHH